MPLLCYVDGYNYLFRLKGDEARFDLLRHEVLSELHSLADKLQLQLIVVFDSHYFEGDLEKSHKGALEVIFTAKGQTADTYILEELERRKEEAIVVTSDKRLRQLAIDHSAKVVSVEVFGDWLHKKAKKKPKKELIPLKPIPKPIPVVAPKEGSVEAYLAVFEQRLAEEEKNRPVKPAKPLSKKLKTQKDREAPPPLDPLSEMERWEKIFEGRRRRLDNDYDQL